MLCGQNTRPTSEATGQRCRENNRRTLIVKRHLIALGVLAVSCLALTASPQNAAQKDPSAKELLDAGLAKAKKEDKRVFLVFTVADTMWCKELDQYHADPKVSALLAKYVVLVRVDINKDDGGKDLYMKYGMERGVPAWTILDANAKVLSDSKDGKDNVGFPYEPDEVTHYFKVLRAACPKLSDAEAGLLGEKLKEFGPKK
jgi:hypothetical protein